MEESVLSQESNYPRTFRQIRVSDYRDAGVFHKKKRSAYLQNKRRALSLRMPWVMEEARKTPFSFPKEIVDANDLPSAKGKEGVCPPYPPSQKGSRYCDLQSVTWLSIYASLSALSWAQSGITAWLTDVYRKLEQLRWRLHDKAKQRRKPRLNICILYFAVGLAVFLTSYYTLGLEVSIGDTSLGFVSSQAEFQSVVACVSERASEILHYPYYLDPNVSFQYSFVDNRLVFDHKQAEEMLFAQISDIKKLYVIAVNGEPICANQSKEGLEAILQDILKRYTPKTAADSVSFVEEVEVRYQWVATAMERSLQSLRKILLGNVRQERYDIAREGDSFSHIALRNGMSERDLQSMNESLPPEKVENGTALRVQWPLPYLSVLAKSRIEFEEPLPYDTQIVEDNDLYVDEVQIRQQGVPGVVKVLADICYINGIETQVQEKERIVTKDSVVELVAKGSKPRPAKVATGTFIRPFWGRFTSGYGVRTLRGVKRNHEGIDMAGPTGSLIVASDGGVVLFAGRRNGYGLCVVLSHGKGLTTLYGHCSALLVKEGQKVAQGETIAKVGNTGNSTGPHLHFEVRENGAPRDPWNYID